MLLDWVAGAGALGATVEKKGKVGKRTDRPSPTGMWSANHAEEYLAEQNPKCGSTTGKSKNWGRTDFDMVKKDEGEAHVLNAREPCAWLANMWAASNREN